MKTLILVLWITLLSSGGLAIVFASLFRCRRCGRWHDSAEEEYHCGKEK